MSTEQQPNNEDRPAASLAAGVLRTFNAQQIDFLARPIDELGLSTHARNAITVAHFDRIVQRGDTLGVRGWHVMALDARDFGRVPSMDRRALKDVLRQVAVSGGFDPRQDIGLTKADVRAYGDAYNRIADAAARADFIRGLYGVHVSAPKR